MDYVEIKFEIDTASQDMEMLIASLSQLGFDGFMENETELCAYIPADDFDENAVRNVLNENQRISLLPFNYSVIKAQNWNSVWESNYEPVTIKEKVHIRAPFHNSIEEMPFEIVLNPKMAFGTAHHETTSLIMELMLEADFKGKKVLDMGCGTGILAIFAEMLGASLVDAIDNDEWAFQNSLENMSENKCKRINVQLGDVSQIKAKDYDIILANINRNVLLRDMPVYATHLRKYGILMLSGFYEKDLSSILSIAKDCQLQLEYKLMKNEWVAAKFIKNDNYIT